MSVTSKKILFWAPYVLAIVYLLFHCLTPEFHREPFDRRPMPGVWDQAWGFIVINSLPWAMQLLVVVLAWRFELVGAAAYTVLGLVTATSASHAIRSGLDWNDAAPLPALLIAGLFLVKWFKRAELRPNDYPAGADTPTP